MAERKVFNKYIPPDFDPSLLPKGERPANGQIKVRSMLPMTICCKTCGEYIARGTKFNSRQEIAQGMDYLGLKRWRFYMKCTGCSSEMTFLTDPENDHYVCEHNCTRTFEPWRAQQEAEQLIKQAKTEEEKYDMMKAMQNRALEEKKRIDLMDTINDIQDINKKNAFIDQDDIINALYNKNLDTNDNSDDTNNENDHDIKRKNKENSTALEEFRARKRIKLDPNIASINIVYNNNNNESDNKSDTNNLQTNNYNDNILDNEHKKIKFDFSKKINNNSTSTSTSTSTSISNNYNDNNNNNDKNNTDKNELLTSGW